LRVVVAEDQFLLRDGLVRLVEAYGHSAVAAVTTGRATLEALLTMRPDVAIVDVRMPPTFSDEGLQAALAARRALPGPRGGRGHQSPRPGGARLPERRLTG
jgi:DNA-binding NarL/FixJ family response regulator